MKIPVLFLIYNRPQLTRFVFDAIRKARPEKLFIAADGPNEVKADDYRKCNDARDVINQVDWDCEISTLISNDHLGCKLGPSHAINWFFDNVEEGIILEDDCFCQQTFFRFCEELLEFYRQDKRIMSISGCNHQFGRLRIKYSYYFSRYRHTWGWATWRRAWQFFDVNMSLWPEMKNRKWLSEILKDAKAEKYWINVFDQVYQNKIDGWDAQWTFACWLQNSLAILPNVNLVSNIGFTEDATHTKDSSSRFANVKIQPMVFPLSHPPSVIQNYKADKYTELIRYSGTFSLRNRLLVGLNRFIRKWYN
ncbi:MAG: glycosyltransferase family 2 protein [Candidatus Omnitrophica bacterium]|nr:glycosyltransferase family 2 protein [Candidatus Omnitrophota bacterium]